MSGCPIGNLLGESSKNFETWIRNTIHNNVVDIEKFVLGIDQWYGDFVRSKMGAYSEDQALKYQDKIVNMKWKEVLEWYGYIINK